MFKSIYADKLSQYYKFPPVFMSTFTFCRQMQKKSYKSHPSQYLVSGLNVTCNKSSSRQACPAAIHRRLYASVYPSMIRASTADASQLSPFRDRRT